MNTATNWRGWAPTGLRIAFGIIFGVDAWLKWQPGFRATFLPNMISTAAVEPHWLAWWFDFVLALERPAPAVFVYIGAVTETLLAFTLVLGVARRVVFVGGALYAMAIWCTADGFGAPYGPGATDIGPGIIYALVFSALLVLLEHGHPSHLTLDAAIVHRFPRWSRVSGPLDHGGVVPRP